MSHTFLALKVNLIPDLTKNKVPNFWKGLFSNDGVKNSDGLWEKEPSRLLLDGNNPTGDLVQDTNILHKWLIGVSDKNSLIETLKSTAIEYTKAELRAQQKQPDSIWYIEPRGDV